MLSILIEKTERSLRLVGVVAPTPRRAIPQIFNIQFPDKTGFTLRFNPGIFDALRPACPGWDSHSKYKQISGTGDNPRRTFELCKQIF